MENRNEWRASVVLPKEIEDRVIRIRQNEAYARCSLSEIIRMLIFEGLAAMDKKEQTKD